VRHVIEVLAALLDTGRSSEVVESDCRVAALRKTQRKLLVEAVETAHVRKNDDPDLSRLVRCREKRSKLVAVARFEDEVVVRDSRTCNRRNRRRRIELEAHGA
jgi:nitrate reductase beta subunit